MSALTYEIKDKNSPVRSWLRTTLPHHKTVQRAYRAGAGTQRIYPTTAVAAQTQGAAIDWLLRMDIDPKPSLALPLAGLMKGRVSCTRAGAELLHRLGALNRDGTTQPMNRTWLDDAPDQTWARVAYALALLVELCRAVSVRGSRLHQLTPQSSALDLLALANDGEVADLLAMRDLARNRLLPALPAGQVFTGMSFDGSADLPADADLIVGRLLIDIKAGQGDVTSDGTRTIGLDRIELDQVLGYALMDYSDEYGLNSVGIYAARFGYLATWPLQELCNTLAGQSMNLPTLRQEFARVLRHQLPPYWESRC
jgi:hypothetical protein